MCIESYGHNTSTLPALLRSTQSGYAESKTCEQKASFAPCPPWRQGRGFLSKKAETECGGLMQAFVGLIDNTITACHHVLTHLTDMTAVPMFCASSDFPTDFLSWAPSLFLSRTIYAMEWFVPSGWGKCPIIGLSCSEFSTFFVLAFDDLALLCQRLAVSPSPCPFHDKCPKGAIMDSDT